jgi:uncharacterized protein (DUF305 family)
MPSKRTALVGFTIAAAMAAVRAEPALYDAGDLAFLQHMIVHHEQALVLCDWVPERSDRHELVRFARYLDRAQAAEIEAMRGLLEIAAERGIAVPEYHPHGDPPMTGMLSTAELAAIGAARGAEFERLWLEGMITHHEGALAMARAQQQRQFERGVQPYEIASLVEDMLVEQRAEITRMRGWLGEWGLAGVR